MKFLVPVLGTVICLAVSAQAEWRRSDALGSDQGPAPAGSGAGWVLRIEPRSGGEQRTLFRDGREQSDRFVDRDAAGRLVRVLELKDGLSVWEVSYDAESGLPASETSFENGRPSQTATLVYQDRVLEKRIVHDANGAWLYTDVLGHWPDGTLRRLERDGPGGALAEAGWSYGAGGRLVESWLADEEAKTRGEHRETLFEKNRRVETLAEGAQTLWTRVTEDQPSGSLETTTEPGAERVTRRRLDAQGRVTEEVVSAKGVVTQTRHWSYDGQGRVVEASTEGSGPREVWSYAFSDGTVVGRLTRGGTLVREEVLRDGEKVSVKLYDRGELFLVETWSQGRRTKETYYRQGQVVRERTP